MSYLHKFGADDIFFNTLETHPEYEFTMYSGSAYLNNESFKGGNMNNNTYENKTGYGIIDNTRRQQRYKHGQQTSSSAFPGGHGMKIQTKH